MTKQDFLSIGFVEYPHKVIDGYMQYDLGRYRELSIQNLGNPNEMVFICEVDADDETEITDLVCVHNYDFDGYLTVEKVILLITAITGRVFKADGCGR